MIDFSIPLEVAALRDDIRAFVTDEIAPYESDPRLTEHGPTDELWAELIELARKRGLAIFQAPAQALQQSWLAIWSACRHLDQGTKGLGPVRPLGGMGISDATPVGMIFGDIRAFRLYDGPTEVHGHAIARQVLRWNGVHR